MRFNFSMKAVNERLKLWYREYSLVESLDFKGDQTSQSGRNEPELPVEQTRARIA